MSSSQHFSVGAIGAGTLAQVIAGHAVAAGHHVIFSNSRGPESLEPLASRFGANASAGTVAEAARAGIVILAVGWDQVPAAVKDVPDWDGRIVIDATNQWQDFSRGIAADLGDQTGSERNAALMPGARVVKAFNALYGRVTAQNPAAPMAASSPSSPATTRTPRPPSQRLPTRWDSRPSTSADCMTPDVSRRSAAARCRGFTS
jgi:8-hydroxy-5-deazaflavin:NADPH oxidoreductase